MPLEVNEISSESSGDVSITDPLKVDQIFPRTIDKVLVGGLPVGGDMNFVNIGQASITENIIGAVIIGRSGENVGGLPGIENVGAGIAIGTENLDQAQNMASNITIGWGCMDQCENDSLNGGARNNVCIGSGAGRNLGIAPTIPGGGSKNVMIGRFAGTTTTTGYNNICIGNEAEPANPFDINTITLGNNQIFSLRCAVQTITSLSDERDKKDIKELPVGLDFVNGLKPVTFEWDERAEGGKKGITDIGFTAQDLKKSQEETDIAETLGLVSESNPDRLEASYGRLLPIMVKAMQELSAEIAELKTEIEQLKKK